jgi:hypothetical protein
MPFPSLHHPFWIVPVETCGGVSRDDWLRAANRTDAELWKQVQRNRTPATPSPSPMPMPSAEAATGNVERPPLPARPAPSPPLNAKRNGTPTRCGLTAEHRAQLKAEGWTFADEAETAPPKGKRRVTRYLPSDGRFTAWIELHGGSASLSAIARRFNLSAEERDVLLGRYRGARDGIITHKLHGRGGGQVFTLLRKPRPPTLPPL